MFQINLYPKAGGGWVRPQAMGADPRPRSLTVWFIVFRLENQVSGDVGLSREDSEPLPPHQLGSSPFVCCTGQVLFKGSS